MECHESLMARRRKKTARNAHRHKAQNMAKLDKSLPSLPPTAVPEMSFSPEVETPSPDSYPPPSVEVPSRKRPSDPRHQGSGSSRKEDSPATTQNQFQGKTYFTFHASSCLHFTDNPNLSIPSDSYRNNRHSTVSQRSDLSGGDEFLIPVAFDPTPPAVQTPQMSVQTTSKVIEEKPRDYFTSTRGTPSSSRKIFTETNGSQPPSPHIAYQERSQERNRPPPIDGPDRRRQESTTSANGLGNKRNSGGVGENFKLQDVPKNKRGESSGSRSESITPRSEGIKSKLNQSKDTFNSVNHVGTSLPGLRNGTELSPRPSHDLPSQEKSPFDTARTGDRSVTSPQSTTLQSLPRRGDSLEGSRTNQAVTRKDIPVTARPSIDQNERVKESSESTSSTSQDSKHKTSQDTQVSKAKPDFQSFVSSQQFTAPRTAPVAPPEPRRDRNESVSTVQSETKTVEKPVSPSLPRYSHGGDFSMEEDMARILGGEEGHTQESFLRRVSNSVRHGRSFSDKGGRLTKEPKWPKSPTSGTTLGQDISSPIMTSPEHRDEIAWFKNELRKERQKAMERDQKISELEAALDSTTNIKQVNSELREKRSTMVVLDTQKEMVVRELEILTEHIAATSQKPGEQMDLGKMKNSILRDFAEALQKLKDSFSPQIEESIQQRNNLIDELTNLNQMKNKSFQEFELLSLKNSQLADLNNSLVQQIQYRYKANSTSSTTPAMDTGKAPPNGLGIYQHHKDKSQVSIDTREVRPNMNEMSLPGSQTTIQQEEAEPITVLQGPHMVSIRKGQPKKFNWKKGGQNITKGVTKGLKGAFTSTQQSYAREMQFAETGSYSSTPMSSEAPSRQTTQDSARQGFGLFGGQKPLPKGTKGWGQQSNGSTTALVDPATSKRTHKV